MTTSHTTPTVYRRRKKTFKDEQFAKGWRLVTRTRHSLRGITGICGLLTPIIYNMIDAKRDLEALGIDPAIVATLSEAQTLVQQLLPTHAEE